MSFRILWGLDAAIALIFLYFFFAGLADGSISSFNIGLWLLILLAIATILGGGYGLRAAGHPGIATALLALLAAPGALYGLFIALLIVSGQSWN